MEEDEEICRVCRSEGTPEQPLFHPCKCSGSIRHVHQDCLLEWLEHSNKRHCELCKHSFSFTPIYSSEMPATIPKKVLIGRAIEKLANMTLFVLRGIFVTFIWLVILPYFTIWIWRLYFWIGETFAYRANGLETPIWNSTSFFTSSHNITSPRNITADAEADGPRWGISVLLFQHIAPEHQWISKFILDCFEGQFIGSVVLVVFVAIFLLREWVLQNQEGEAVRMAMNDAVAPMAGAEVEAPAFNMEHAVERFIAVQHRIEAVVEGDADLSDSDSDGDRDDEGAQVERLQQPVEGAAPVIDARGEHRQEMIRQINERGVRLRLQNAAGNQPEQNPLQEEIPARQFPLAPPAALADPAPFVPPPPRPLAPPAPAVIDQEDEVEDLNVEELDGVLEVIGMHGSFWLLLQNSLLIAALICAILGFGVWIPFMIGKTILLMSPFNILRLPHAVLSRLTDPILDYIFDRVLPYAGAALSKAITTINSQPLEMLYQNHIVPTWNAIVEIGASRIVQDVSLKDSPVSVVTETLIPGQPALNGTNTIIIHHVAQKWTELAYGTSSGDKFAAIMIGYAILFGVAYLYFVQTPNAYGYTFARVARDVLRQQGLILKITFFVAIEMVLFPLFCGVVIGLSTLPLFKDATVASRLAFYRFSPNVSLILHWLVGTAFMFNFSCFVGYCRGIVRPGVMWFIRDPNDEAFHPIREILERPALLQLRKLASGAFMYFTLIILGITMTIHSVNILLKGVLPLRWRVDEPISDLPIELLLFHLVFPLTARWLNPTSRLRIIFAAWWRKLAHWLRLSSFMYASEGQRYYDEEGHVVYRSWKAWLLRWRPPIPGQAAQDGQSVGSGEELDIDAPVIFVRDGGLLRVPNSDRNFHLKDRRVLIPVDQDGNALDPSEDIPGEIDPLMELPERRRGGVIDPKENTIIVYAPPHFGYRLITFIVLLWTSIMTFLVLSVIIPVVVGRAIVKLKTEQQVHDVYAILIGVYALRGLWFVVDWASSKIINITSHGLQPIDLKAQIRVAKNVCLLGAKLLYFGLTFGIVMPFTMGLIVELYVVLPLRTAADDPESGIIFAVLWAVGLLYMKIVHRILSVMTNNRYAVDMNRVFNGANVHNWDAILATRRLILPLLGMAALAVVGPFALAWIAAEGLGLTGTVRLRVFRHMYPSVMMISLILFGLMESLVIVRGWSQYVRDQEYLVGRRLHNLHEEHQEPPATTGAADAINDAAVATAADAVPVEVGAQQEPDQPSPQEQEHQPASIEIIDSDLFGDEEEEENRAPIRPRRIFTKQPVEPITPSLTDYAPLLRSRSRRVRDPPVGSEVEDDDEGESIAQRTRLRRSRRLQAQEEALNGGQGSSNSIYK